MADMPEWYSEEDLEYPDIPDYLAKSLVKYLNSAKQLVVDEFNCNGGLYEMAQKHCSELMKTADTSISVKEGNFTISVSYGEDDVCVYPDTEIDFTEKMNELIDEIYYEDESEEIIRVLESMIVKLKANARES